MFHPVPRLPLVYLAGIEDGSGLLVLTISERTNLNSEDTTRRANSNFVRNTFKANRCSSWTTTETNFDKGWWWC